MMRRPRLECIPFWIKAAILEGLLIDVTSQTKWLTKRPWPKPLRLGRAITNPYVLVC